MKKCNTVLLNKLIIIIIIYTKRAEQDLFNGNSLKLTEL